MSEIGGTQKPAIYGPQDRIHRHRVRLERYLLVRVTAVERFPRLDRSLLRLRMKLHSHIRQVG